jgi:hypothetical protein
MTRMVTTKLRCPQCNCADLSLIETGSWSSAWSVKDGRFDRDEGFHMPESVDRLDARCSDCGHFWKPRRAFQIDHVVVDDGTSTVTATEGRAHD